MSFIRLCVDRPVLTTMVVGSLIVFGLFSFTQLSQDLVPKVEFPFVVVTTIYPGAGPKEIESQVTEKLEDEIGSVAGLKRMESQSLESLSLILLEFELDVDADLAAIEVKDKVDLAMINLPDDVQPPVVQQYSFDSFPVLNVAVYSDRPLPEITRLADTRIKDAVARVDGVSKVELIGGLQREIHVACRADRLRSYGLSILDVVGLIQAENFNFPLGRIIGSASEFSLRMVGEMNDLERLRSMRIPVANGAAIRLRDVADVNDAWEEPRAEARFQGKPAVSLQVMKKNDANSVEVSEGVHAAMTRLAPWIAQENLTAEIINDRAKYIEDSVADVTGNIWVGVILTSILLYLFLHDYRQTFIVAVVMPGSVVATFALMNFAGFTLNIISLMAIGKYSGIAANFLGAMDRERALITSRAIFGAANAVVNVVLIPRYGAWGATIGTAAATLAGFAYEAVLLHRALRPTYPWKFVAKISLASAVMGLAVAGVCRYVPPADAWRLAVGLPVGVCVFGAMLVVLRPIDPAILEIVGKTRIPGAAFAARWLTPRNPGVGS